MDGLPPLPASVRLLQGSLRTSVPVEAWVAGVVAAETLPGTAQAAREAQAVLARTLAARGGAHPGGALCARTHCMAWTATADSGAREAANRTAGWILADGAKPAFPACHASCGGHTAAWPAGFPGVLDPACRAQHWERHWPAAWLDPILQDAGPLQVEVGPDGRAWRVRRGRSWQDADVFAVRMGRRHGWHAVPSTLFSVTAMGDGWRASGSGRGHGKGLCQQGAAVMGRDGRTWQQILRHYLPWATLRRLATAAAVPCLLLGHGSPAAAVPLPDSLATRITRHARESALRHLDGKPPLRPADLGSLPPGGVFISWVLGGKTRACWGRLDPDRPSLGDQIAQEAIRSLDHDPRTPPLTRREVRSLGLLVSLPDRPLPLTRLEWLAPARDGLLLVAAGRQALVLPGEARTPTGMLLRCRDKAGVSRRTRGRLWRFTTRTAWSEGKG